MFGHELTNRQKQGAIIRNNHFNLYHKIASICSFSIIEDDFFSAIHTKIAEWPNMIFNVKCKDSTESETLHKIKMEIDNEILPRFLIIDDFEKTTETIHLLKKNGFIAVMRWPGMISDLTSYKSTSSRSVDFQVRKVSSREMLNHWIDIVNRTLFTQIGLNTDNFINLILSETLIPYLGYYKNIPVSTMLVNYEDFTAGIYVASTLPQYSGRGFMSTFIDYIFNEAKDRGSKHSILESNKSSHRLYSKCGFTNVCNFDIFWKAKSVTNNTYQ